MSREDLEELVLNHLSKSNSDFKKHQGKVGIKVYINSTTSDELGIPGSNSRYINDVIVELFSKTPELDENPDLANIDLTNPDIFKNENLFKKTSTYKKISEKAQNKKQPEIVGDSNEWFRTRIGDNSNRLIKTINKWLQKKHKEESDN
jgi:hypothetical protein